ncbi:Threonine/homoserine/homoserine lactone efflux protein [Candidatus Pantoea symbiotica]|uniref:Threonine/homoserine/homoserine lactone efflux protein n=1 Tax=Candidatus Pantoea symbiotica TaxID=1884370 RepID=A0A1I3VBF1_9GAMM|nr:MULTISPECIES: LysE family translocator [Pantoea]SFJ91517.1 Threonine/homoserine/homoserine lactone efflux protein [Pantoea symbiotica]SFU63573.1 Threonine/homoserine/homoserine lactone efflux protein [Pantoea sp. YR525]
MALSFFAAFWAVSVLFVITPGADWAYAISAGIRGGRVIPAVCGLLSGHLIATLIVAAGVGAVVADLPWLMKGLTVAGACYLIWLGIGMLRHPAVPTADERQLDGNALSWAVKGLCISGLNPKVFLLFLALLPQFTDSHGTWPLSLQMAALGMVHVVSCAVVYLIVGFGSKAVLQTRPRAARLVSQISGALMIIIAALLLTESFR